MILHSRFYRPLITSGVYGSSGTFTHPSWLPVVPTPPGYFTKGQVVESGDQFMKRGGVGGQNYDNHSGVIDYNGDILLKRVRLYANLPGAFYASTLNTLGLGWFHDRQSDNGDWYLNQCHWTTIPVINMGEWVDINVNLPRNNTMLRDFGHDLYSHFRIGAWFGAGTYYYANVPFAFQGQTVQIGLELETALTVEPRTWEGDTK